MKNQAEKSAIIQCESHWLESQPNRNGLFRMETRCWSRRMWAHLFLQKHQITTNCWKPLINHWNWWTTFSVLPMLNTTGCCCHCGMPASWMIPTALLLGSWASDGPGHVMCSFLSKGHKSEDFILSFLSEAGVHHAEWGIPANKTGGWLWWQSG